MCVYDYVYHNYYRLDHGHTQLYTSHLFSTHYSPEYIRGSDSENSGSDSDFCSTYKYEQVLFKSGI